MTRPDPRPTTKKPIEKKLTWGAIGTYLGGLALLAFLNLIQGDASLISGLPDALEAILLPLVPTLVQMVAAYNASHTYRPDLGEVPPGPANQPYRPTGGPYTP